MTVFKKGNNNKWYYRFQLNGKEYYRACKGAVDKKTALEYEAVIKAEIMRGNLGIAENRIEPKLEQGIDIYLQYSEINKRSYKTDVVFTKHFKEFFKNIELVSITPSLIEDFKKYLVNEYNLKNASINRHLEALSKMFNLCIENKLVKENAMRKVKKMKKDNYRIRYLTKAEEKTLFEYIPEHLKPIVICALKTGMRKGEILNLKWHNVDFKDNYIEPLKTKSGKSRKIPISKKLRVLLLSLKKTSVSEYVFVNPETGINYRDIKRSFNTAVKNSKIKKCRFHDLRHTFATRLIAKGVDIVVVKELLGHADIKTTMVYVHSDAERKINAINAIDTY